MLWEIADKQWCWFELRIYFRRGSWSWAGIFTVNWLPAIEVNRSPYFNLHKKVRRFRPIWPTALRPDLALSPVVQSTNFLGRGTLCLGYVALWMRYYWPLISQESLNITCKHVVWQLWLNTLISLSYPENKWRHFMKEACCESAPCTCRVYVFALWVHHRNHNPLHLICTCLYQRVAIELVSLV